MDIFIKQKELSSTEIQEKLIYQKRDLKIKKRQTPYETHNRKISNRMEMNRTKTKWKLPEIKLKWQWNYC